MKVGNIEVRIGDVWRKSGYDPVTVLATHREAAWCSKGCDGRSAGVFSFAGLGELIRRATDPEGEVRNRKMYAYSDEAGGEVPGDGKWTVGDWKPYGATYRRALVPAEPLAAVAWQVTREESGIVTVDAGDGRGTFLAVVGAGRDGYTCVGFADDAESRDECVRDPSMISAISSKIPCGMVAGRLSVARWAIMVRG